MTINTTGAGQAHPEVLDAEVERVVTALRTTIYQRTAEHVLDASTATIDKAISLGLVRVVKVQSTTYMPRGERMLAAVNA